MMKKITALILVLIISFLWGQFTRKTLGKKISSKENTMAYIRRTRFQAIKKALKEGKKEYEFEVGYIVPLSE